MRHSLCRRKANPRPKQRRSAGSQLPLFLHHILHFPGPSLARWLFGADEGNGALVSFDFQGVCRGSDLAGFALQLQNWLRIGPQYKVFPHWVRPLFIQASTECRANLQRPCRSFNQVSTATHRRQISASSLYLRAGKALPLIAYSTSLSRVETSFYLVQLIMYFNKWLQFIIAISRIGNILAIVKRKPGKIPSEGA